MYLGGGLIMGSESGSTIGDGSEVNKDVVKLNINPILPLLTKSKMVLSIGNRYRMVILKQSRTRGVYSAAIDLGSKPYCIEDFANEEELADRLRGCPDLIIASNADHLANAVFGYIKRWKVLLAVKELNTSFNSKIIQSGSLGEKVPEFSNQTLRTQNLFSLGAELDKYVVEWFNQFSQLVRGLRERFNKCSEGSEFRKRACQKVAELWNLFSNMQPNSVCFDDILSIVLTIFYEEVAELLENVATAGLTLRFVDRDRGIVGNRPVWLLIISRPSAMKTIVLDMFRESPYVFYVTDVTKASFLPADPEQEPLIAKMHNKVTIFPTLSSIASKKLDEAKEILAVLESIYDGEYRRSTARGTRGLPIDTVVIGAITPEIFELDMLPKMISYGSRFVIHRYDISQEQALTITYLLGDAVGTHLPNVLTKIVSTLFTHAFESTNFEKLMNVALTPSHESDLDVLADLMSRLRVVVHRRVDWIVETDVYTGREKWRKVEVAELSQYDAPIRSRLQLLNFVRANSVIRSVPRIVGLPQADDHAMKLACKLTISSSYRCIHQIIAYLLRHHDVVNVSTSDIAETLGLSRSTVNSFIDALYVAGVVTDAAMPRLEEKYYKVLSKYLMGKKEGDGGKNT
jgi:biotin operon repressor